jgi:hypothetical protein
LLRREPSRRTVPSAAKQGQWRSADHPGVLSLRRVFDTDPGFKEKGGSKSMPKPHDKTSRIARPPRKPRTTDARRLEPTSI